MKPKSPLPWILLDSNGQTRQLVDNGKSVDVNWYNVEDDNFIATNLGDEVLGCSEALRLNKQDAKYIVHACNNLPKAIKLLQAVMGSSYGLLSEEFRKNISDFLESN